MLVPLDVARFFSNRGPVIAGRRWRRGGRRSVESRASSSSECQDGGRARGRREWERAPRQRSSTSNLIPASQLGCRRRRDHLSFDE